MRPSTFRLFTPILASSATCSTARKSLEFIISAGCTALESLRVSGGASGRASKNCLRMRRDALFDHYLERQNPALWAWLGQRGLTPPPAAWVAARVPDGQQLLEVHALLEPSLLEAVTRSNDDFLNAGHAGVEWSRQLARAAQVQARLAKRGFVDIEHRRRKCQR